MKKLNFTDLKVKKEQKYNELIDNCRVFFAFNNEQFKKGIEKCELKEGEKVISIGNGGYMPKKNVENWIQGQKDIEIWFKNATKSMKEDHILYELNNHECFYTGSIEDAKDDLPYSEKMILDVFRKNRHLYE